MKKNIILGIVTGAILSSTVLVGASSSEVTGTLTTKNPLFTAPKGYATTNGYKTITAKCYATKDGSQNWQEEVKTTGKSGGKIESDWVFGPGFTSSGTKFKSVHTGYNSAGKYKVLEATKNY